MALTQEQWYQKLKSWVPQWWFEQERYNIAVFKAIAKVFSELESDIEAHIDETFITRASDHFLDAHGSERNVDRLSLEVDSLYADRIRRIINQSNRVAIKRIVDAMLIVGECKLIEHGLEGPFASRGTYANRREIYTDRRWNQYFTVLIEKQIAASNSFANRSTFASRQNYIGTIGPLPIEILLSSINTAIQKARAGGVLYRLIEQ